MASLQYLWFKSPVFSLGVRPSGVEEAEILIAAGGGGASRTGIANAISVIGFVANDDDESADGSSSGRQAMPPLPRRLHDVDTGDNLILHLAVSPNGRAVAAVAGTHVMLFSLRRGTEPSMALVHTFEAMKASGDAGLNVVSWSPDGASIAVGGDDGSISVWLVAAEAGPTASEIAVTAATDASTTAPATPQIAGNSLRKRALKASVVVVDGSPLKAAAASASATVSSTTASRGSGISRPPPPTPSSPEFVYDGGCGGVINLSLVPTPPSLPLYTLRGHTGSVEALSFGPSHGGGTTLLASAAKDGTARVWQIPTRPPHAQAGGISGSRDSGSDGMNAVATAADAAASAPTCISVFVHVLPLVGKAMVGDRYAPRKRGTASAGAWSHRCLVWDTGAAAPRARLLVLESSQRGAAIVCEWLGEETQATTAVSATAAACGVVGQGLRTGQPPPAVRSGVDAATATLHEYRMGAPAAEAAAAAVAGPVVGAAAGSTAHPPPTGDSDGPPAQLQQRQPQPHPPQSQTLSWRCARWQVVRDAPVSTMSLQQPVGNDLLLPPEAATSTAHPHLHPRGRQQPQQLLALGTSEGSLLLLNGRTFAPVRSAISGTSRAGLRPELHGFPITSIAFLPLHGYLATGSADSQIAIVRMPEGYGINGAERSSSACWNAARGLLAVALLVLVLGMVMVLVACPSLAVGDHGAAHALLSEPCTALMLRVSGYGDYLLRRLNMTQGILFSR